MIIVTGGAGFIGSNLVRGLNLRGEEDVLVVDDLEAGDKHRGLNALEFTDLVDYRDFLDDPDRYVQGKVTGVFHQGACSDTMNHDGRYMLRVNYEYSKALYAHAVRWNAPFLYASSAATYGDGSAGFREELACENPLNVYGFSKYVFDRWIRQRLDDSPVQVAGLRYFNVYGPQENHKGRMASVVYKFHHQIQEHGKLEIFEGSDDFRRDFVWVGDAVDLNLWLLDHPDVRGVFNCGTGTARSFADFAHETASHYEGVEIVEVPFPDALKGKYQAFTQADLTQLRAAGYDREFTSLADGVATYVDLLKNSEGYWTRGGAR